MSHPHIVVVDGDRASAQRICRIAESMAIPCRVFTTAEEMIEAHAFDAGGVVVSEFRLLGINGIDMQQKLRTLNADVQVLFHTAFAETWLTVSAMQSGAFSVLDKPAGEQELWDAIRLAMDRYRKIHEQKRVVKRLRYAIQQLNPRQQQVLDLMVEGHPNKLIANQLDISIRTVESYRHAIFETTVTQSLAELVRLVTIARLEGD